MILKAPKTAKPKKPTQHQAQVMTKIAKSDPPVVCVSIKEKGLHYSIGNGDTISGRMVLELVGRGWLRSNRDGLGDMTPQTYRLTFAPQAEVLEAAE